MKRVTKSFESIGELTPEEARELQKQTTTYLAAAMARRSPLLRRELEIMVRQQSGTTPSSGHMVDMLMNCAARMERGLTTLDEQTFTDAAVAILCLARDIAYNEGKMKAAPSGPPS
jgi:hypothetical protein